MRPSRGTKPHTQRSNLVISDISYARKRCVLRIIPPRNNQQNAIFRPAQTFNLRESYMNATSMYGRTTFLAPTILLTVALGIPPA